MTEAANLFPLIKVPEVNTDANTANANARLIAASPELLSSLERMLALFSEVKAISQFDWGNSGLDADTIRELNEAPLQARAIIAKAQGGVL